MLRAEEQSEFSRCATDVARSDGEHGISGPGFTKQPLDALLERAAIDYVLVACGTNRFRQRRGRDATNRLFTRGIDIRHDQEVGLIEGAAEVVPEVLRARKAVRLKKHQQAVVTAAARGLERGANLHRMMAVVIDQGNAAHGAFDLKAPPHTGK